MTAVGNDLGLYGGIVNASLAEMGLTYAAER